MSPPNAINSTFEVSSQETTWEYSCEYGYSMDQNDSLSKNGFLAQNCFRAKVVLNDS